MLVSARSHSHVPLHVPQVLPRAVVQLSHGYEYRNRYSWDENVQYDMMGGCAIKDTMTSVKSI